MGKKTSSSINGAGKTGQGACKTIQLNQFLTPCTKISQKWIKDLHVRPKAIKIPRRKQAVNSLTSVFTNIFFGDLSPRARDTKINKQNYIKLKCFCTEKYTINKNEEAINLLNGKRYLQMIDPTRGQYPKYTKSSYNSTSKNKKLSDSVKKQWT